MVIPENQPWRDLMRPFEWLRPRNTHRATYTLVIPQVVPLFHVVSLLLVSSLSVDLLLFNILKKSFLSLKFFLTGSHFLFFFFFIFIAHFRLPTTFAVNPLFISCHNCLSDNSLISSLISTKLLSVFVLQYVSSTSQTIFRLKKTP